MHRVSSRLESLAVDQTPGTWMAGRVFCPIVFWIVVLADSAAKSSVWPVYRSPVDSLTNTYTKYTAAFLRKRKALNTCCGPPPVGLEPTTRRLTAACSTN